MKRRFAIVISLIVASCPGRAQAVPATTPVEKPYLKIFPNGNAMIFYSNAAELQYSRLIGGACRIISKTTNISKTHFDALNNIREGKPSAAVAFVKKSAAQVLPKEKKLTMRDLDRAYDKLQLEVDNAITGGNKLRVLLNSRWQKHRMNFEPVGISFMIANRNHIELLWAEADSIKRHPERIESFIAAIQATAADCDNMADLDEASQLVAPGMQLVMLADGMPQLAPRFKIPRIQPRSEEQVSDDNQ